MRLQDFTPYLEKRNLVSNGDANFVGDRRRPKLHDCECEMLHVALLYYNIKYTIDFCLVFARKYWLRIYHTTTGHTSRPHAIRQFRRARDADACATGDGDGADFRGSAADAADCWTPRTTRTRPMPSAPECHRTPAVDWPWPGRCPAGWRYCWYYYCHRCWYWCPVHVAGGYFAHRRSPLPRCWMRP